MRRWITSTLRCACVVAIGCGGPAPAGSASASSSGSSSTGDVGGTGGAGGAGAGGNGAGAGGGGGGDLPAADPTGFRVTGALAVGRGHHTMTLLADGRVLVTGGETAGRAPLDDVEVFDPAAETWSVLAPLPEARTNHGAVLLDDGRVLITGGGLTNQNGNVSGEGVVGTALVFDPLDGSFVAVGDMEEPRAGHAMARLADGRVLVAGGGTDAIGSTCTGVPGCTYGKAVASAEVFDPATGTFAPVSPMSDPRHSFFMTTLADGRPIVAGGADDASSLSSVEIYEPTSATFVPTGELLSARFRLSGALLGSGNVVVAGGKLANVGPLDSTEVLDVAAGTWSAAGDLERPMTGAVVVALESGRALTIGGYDQTRNESLASAAIFDESVGAWAPIAPLAEARFGATATRLADGRVLVVGGYTATEVCEISE